MTPMKFLSIEEFEKRQKSLGRSEKLTLMSSMMKIKSDVIEKKKEAKKLKEKGNAAFQKKNLEEA